MFRVPRLRQQPRGHCCRDKILMNARGGITLPSGTYMHQQNITCHYILHKVNKRKLTRILIIEQCAHSKQIGPLDKTYKKDQSPSDNNWEECWGNLSGCVVLAEMCAINNGGKWQCGKLGAISGRQSSRGHVCIMCTLRYLHMRTCDTCTCVHATHAHISKHFATILEFRKTVAYGEGNRSIPKHRSRSKHY